MNRYQRSRAFEHYRKTLRCPNGHRYALSFSEGEGEVVRRLGLRDRLMLENPLSRPERDAEPVAALESLRRSNHERHGALVIKQFRVDSHFACGTCGGQWPVFERGEARVLNIRERDRFETPLTPEVIRHDQTAATTDAVWEVELSRGWNMRIDVDWEHAQTSQTTAKVGAKAKVLGVGLGADVQRQVTDSLKQRSSVSLEVQESRRYKTEYILPAGVITHIVIFWKQVWQRYEFSVRLPDGLIVETTYSLPVDVRYDHEVRHEARR
jgi:hypothetical protein